MNDERRRAVEVALQRMINQHPYVTPPELIAAGIENALSWPQMEIPAVKPPTVPPAANLAMELRGRWGCGCHMADCDLRWGYVRASGAVARVEVVCLTHGLGGASDTLEHGAPVNDHMQVDAIRRLNLAHEEQCR